MRAWASDASSRPRRAQQPAPASEQRQVTLRRPSPLTSQMPTKNTLSSPSRSSTRPADCATLAEIRNYWPTSVDIPTAGTVSGVPSVDASSGWPWSSRSAHIGHPHRMTPVTELVVFVFFG
jgi:hypothetical protein